MVSFHASVPLISVDIIAYYFNAKRWRSLPAKAYIQDLKFRGGRLDKGGTEGSERDEKRHGEGCGECRPASWGMIPETFCKLIMLICAF